MRLVALFSPVESKVNIHEWTRSQQAPEAHIDKTISFPRLEIKEVLDTIDHHPKKIKNVLGEKDGGKQ